VRIPRAAVLVLGLAWGCGDSSENSPATDDLALSGGATTVFDATSGAFKAPAPNLSGESFAQHQAGDAQFEATFVTPPAPVNSGLGPIFNNTSCGACHVGDGRGRPPLPGEEFGSILLRVSVPGAGVHGGPAPAPGFGEQLQLRAVVGSTPEAHVAISYEETGGTFGDGTPYSLRRPTYGIADPYSPLPAGLLVSPRVAPPVFGLGLLEAVPEPTVLAHADPGDADSDGISGRANYVWDEEQQQMALGRFGWKSNTPTLSQQTAAAYSNDMGVTSALFPAETCAGQAPECGTHDPEVAADLVELVVHYTRTLGVPARRQIGEAETSRGDTLFRQIGCADCHLPVLATGTTGVLPELAGQTIRPYTDLLLHDMGPDLADDRPDFDASGSEWRTPPLWGIGLTEVVNGHSNFLHDGRARSVMEAILWHGGEGAAARDRFKALPAADRQAVIAFLHSL
jgi:CxxC motif-containing protein (DUF1111 family)